MSRELGADELRMRTILRQQQVGPDAVPPKPTARPRDWLDDILDQPAVEPDEAPKAAPATAPAPTQPANPKPEKTRKTSSKKRKNSERPKPGTARTAWDTRPPSPRQSLLDAWDQVPYRLKWLAYHAAAAYLGWSAGIVDWVTYVTAWIAATGLIGVQATFWYAVAAAAFLLHHVTRRRWWPLAWLATLPATSVVVGALLYGTGYQP